MVRFYNSILIALLLPATTTLGQVFTLEDVDASNENNVHVEDYIHEATDGDDDEGTPLSIPGTPSKILRIDSEAPTLRYAYARDRSFALGGGFRVDGQRFYTSGIDGIMRTSNERTFGNFRAFTDHAVSTELKCTMAGNAKFEYQLVVPDTLSAFLTEGYVEVEAEKRSGGRISIQYDFDSTTGKWRKYLNGLPLPGNPQFGKIEDVNKHFNWTVEKGDYIRLGAWAKLRASSQFLRNGSQESRYQSGILFVR